MKKLLGFLVGAIVTITGVAGISGAGVAALDAEVYIKAKESVYLDFSDRFLMTELKMSGDPEQEYIKVELNDSKYEHKNVATLAIDRTNGAWAISSIVSMGIWPIDSDNPIVMNRENFEFFRHIGDEMTTRLLFYFNVVAPISGMDGRPNEITIRYIDFSDCAAGWEEGMLCVLDREEDNKLYYAASWDGFDGKRRVSEEDGEGDGEIEEGLDEEDTDTDETGGDASEDNGDGMGGNDEELVSDESSVVEITKDEPTTDVPQGSKRQTARSFAVVKNNETDDDAGAVEEEVLDGWGEAEYEDEGEELGVPLAGQMGEAGLQGAWVFWLVGLVAVAWLMLIIFRRRHEHENKKAIANIVAETKK